MKRLVVLVALCLAGTSTAAVDGGSNNLKRAALCFTERSVWVSDELRTLSPNIASEVYKKLVAKLTAYRVNYLPTCANVDNQIVFVIDGFRAKSGTFSIYVAELKVLSTLIYPDSAVIWGTSVYGTTPDQGTALSQLFVNAASDQVDSLAADYAKANP